MVRVFTSPFLWTRVRSRALSTLVRSSVAYTKPESQHHESTSTTPSGLSDEQRACLDRAVRVDQAGEVAANWIYRGQMAVLGKHQEAGLIIQVS